MCSDSFIITASSDFYTGSEKVLTSGCDCSGSIPYQCKPNPEVSYSKIYIAEDTTLCSTSVNTSNGPSRAYLYYYYLNKAELLCFGLVISVHVFIPLQSAALGAMHTKFRNMGVVTRESQYLMF